MLIKLKNDLFFNEQTRATEVHLYIWGTIFKLKSLENDGIFCMKK